MHRIVTQSGTQGASFHSIFRNRRACEARAKEMNEFRQRGEETVEPVGVGEKARAKEREIQRWRHATRATGTGRRA